MTHFVIFCLDPPPAMPHLTNNLPKFMLSKSYNLFDLAKIAAAPPAHTLSLFGQVSNF